MKENYKEFIDFLKYIGLINKRQKRFLKNL